jgi:catechol 2,3-dioxygenase-like lactoylglutathione lyase family enzyme
MIIGTHVLFYSTKPEADRAFFRDVLGFRSVDAGEGWLIFAMPPTEAAFHPSDGELQRSHAGRPMMGAVIYLMCDDLHSLMKSLHAKNVKCTEIEEAPWGIRTSIPLPSGSEIGLYQPTHPSALDLGS